MYFARSPVASEQYCSEMGFETGDATKPIAAGEWPSYDYCLLERAVTYEFVPFVALMDLENVR